jgi:uncharacterized protein (DUF927 family)
MAEIINFPPAVEAPRRGAAPNAQTAIATGTVPMVAPGLAELIASAHIPEEFEVDGEGLKHISETKDGLAKVTLVSSPIWVVARARLGDGGAWSQNVVFLDPDGKLKEQLIRLSAFLGNGTSVQKSLADDGVQIEHWPLLRKCLTTAKPTKRITLVENTGWVSDEVFMVGAEAVGNMGGETFCPAPGTEVNHLLRRGGSYEAWREGMALLPGNSRLLLAVGAAFAAPLLTMTGTEQGGFHFYNDSSTGKSTSLYAAGSVWGGGGTDGKKKTGFLRQWAMNANNIDGILVQHNDLLLVLDEIHQADPKDVGPMIYSAANGIGKARGMGNGSLRKSKEWQTMILSSGECSAAEVIRRAGYKVNAGQEVRLCDILAEAGAGLGNFQHIHHFGNPSDFAEHLKAVFTNHYGWAGPMFVEKAIASRDMVVEYVEDTRKMFMMEVVPPGADGQVRRVANRFALVAAAGELATCWGIVPWESDDSLKAARECFEFWLENRGGIGSGEGIRGVRQVLDALAADGMRKFVPLRELCQTANRDDVLGFREQGENGEWEFWAHSVGFAKLIGQFDKGLMEKALKERGILISDKHGKPSTVKNVPGMVTTRFHRLRFVEAAD